jgi:carbon-monoxide dehydrogenase small subunit
MGDTKKPDKDSGNPPPRPLNPKQQSRRDFLEGAGTTAVVATAVPVLGISAANAQQANAASGPTTSIRLTVNGVSHSVDVEDRWTLVELLRDQLDLTGTKIGCDRGECGACTVLMNGTPVYSCSQLAVWVDGAEITTVEGLAQNGQLSTVQQAFVDNNGPQCGFCTPGMIMSSKHLLDKNPNPTEEEIRWGISGNLCRCTGYLNIVKAVQYASNKLQETPTE